MRDGKRGRRRTGEEEDWGKKKIEKQEAVGLHTLPSRDPPNTPSLWLCNSEAVSIPKATRRYRHWRGGVGEQGSRQRFGAGQASEERGSAKGPHGAGAGWFTALEKADKGGCRRTSRAGGVAQGPADRAGREREGRGRAWRTGSKLTQTGQGADGWQDSTPWEKSRTCSDTKLMRDGKRGRGRTGEEEDWGKKKIEKQEAVGLHTLPSRDPPNTPSLWLCNSEAVFIPKAT
ncbi:hypothetical protein Taro_051243, partial [Colocasia esculenta]|nr:hypothetical protein [Colocasia esculenta]